jgi:hypothetical protein
LTGQRKKPIREVLREGEADRLGELLPAGALEEALEGLEPEEITGPGGLLTQLAGVYRICWSDPPEVACLGPRQPGTRVFPISMSSAAGGQVVGRGGWAMTAP